MRHHMTTLSALMLIMSAQGASAQDKNFDDYSVDVGLSSFGQTVTPGYRINDSFGLRMPIGYIGFTDEESSGNASIDSKLTISGVGLIADYYPVEQLQGLRVSGGIMAPMYELTMDSSGNKVEINGVDYSVDYLNAQVQNKGPSPYLGVGYRLDASDFGKEDNGWGLAFDVGAIFNMKYSASYEYDKSKLNAAQRHELETQVNEDLADIKKELNDNGSILPWISIAASYRF